MSANDDTLHIYCPAGWMCAGRQIVVILQGGRNVSHEVGQKWNAWWDKVDGGQLNDPSQWIKDESGWSDADLHNWCILIPTTLDGQDALDVGASESYGIGDFACTLEEVHVGRIVTHNGKPVGNMEMNEFDYDNQAYLTQEGGDQDGV